MDPTSQLIAFGGQTVSFSPFQTTLNGGSASRLGDDLTTVNSFWSSNTAHAALFTNTGIQTYTGFYAGTLLTSVTCVATLGGAAGWMNCRGRKIRATFSFNAGDRLVFFAGKTTAKATSASQQVGAGGGASCLMLHTNSGFTPLIVAAGGQGCFEAREPTQEAKPLNMSDTVSKRNTIRSQRDSVVGNSTPDGAGGAGRSTKRNAQQAGAGWHTAAYEPSTTNSNSGLNIDSRSEALKDGARGGPSVNSNAADGGFGGGGGDYDGNCYGCGAGGYFGSWESAQSCSNSPLTSAVFEYYLYAQGQNDYLGSFSYVDSSGTSVSDLGHNGLAQGYSYDGGQTTGFVTLDFS